MIAVADRDTESRGYLLAQRRSLLSQSNKFAARQRMEVREMHVLGHESASDIPEPDRGRAGRKRRIWITHWRLGFGVWRSAFGVCRSEFGFLVSAPPHTSNWRCLALTLIRVWLGKT